MENNELRDPIRGRFRQILKNGVNVSRVADVSIVASDPRLWEPVQYIHMDSIRDIREPYVATMAYHTVEVQPDSDRFIDDLFALTTKICVISFSPFERRKGQLALMNFKNHPRFSRCLTEELGGHTLYSYFLKELSHVSSH